MPRGLLMGTCLIGTRIDPRPQEHGTFWETVGLCLAGCRGSGRSHGLR